MDLRPVQMGDKDFVMKVDSHVNELQYRNRVCTKQDMSYGRTVNGQDGCTILFYGINFLF